MKPEHTNIELFTSGDKYDEYLAPLSLVFKSIET